LLSDARNVVHSNCPSNEGVNLSSLLEHKCNFVLQKRTAVFVWHWDRHFVTSNSGSCWC